MAMDPNIITVICATLGTTITGLILQIMQYLREGRAHRWQMDKADYDEKERNRIARELKDHTEKVTTMVVGKIDNNTEISRAAFREANDVNNKLVAIGEARIRKDSGRRGDGD